MRVSSLLVICAALVIAACDNDRLIGAACPAGAATPAALRGNGIRAAGGGGGGGGGGGSTTTETDPASPNAATAAELIAAMDVPVSVTGATLADRPNQAAAYSSLGAIAPTKGATFAYLSTGVAGATTPQTLDTNATTIKDPGSEMGGAACADTPNTFDCAALTFTFVVPAGMHTVAFDFNFLSGEYPEYVGSDFNDTFQVSMTSAAGTIADIVHDAQNNPIDVNSVLFTQPCTELTGTGFDVMKNGTCDAGATGLLTTQAPVTPGDTVTMNFEVYDASDDIWDSAVMIDNFRFETTTVSNPTTGNGTPTPTPACQ